MKTNLLIIVFSLFIASTAFAQIKGSVVDEKRRPLPGAVLQFFSDKKPVAILLTDVDGRFNFTGSAVVLRVSCTGHLADTLRDLRPDMIIQLRTDTTLLKEVNITSRRPLIRQEADRTVICVNDQIKKLADNALEIVSLAPGITISDNADAITIMGKADVQIMMNDKVVRMKAADLVKMLKAMPSDNIKQIELMTDSPAKYDVNGNTAIINIKTNAVAKGVAGNIDLSTSQSKYNWSDMSGLVNCGLGRLAISGYLAWHRGSYLTQNHKVRYLEPDTLTQWTSDLDQWSDPVFRITADQAIGRKSSIGAIMEREASTNTGSYSTYSLQNGGPYLTVGNNPNTRRWGTYNINYRFRDTLGTEVTIDLDNAELAKTDQLAVNTAGRSGANYQSHTSISIKTFKADHIHSWKDGSKLETGIRIAGVLTDNSQNADNFKYHENIYAAYTSWSGSTGRWGWSVGLRAELTSARGEAAGVMKPDTGYLNLLPSVYLTFAPAAEHHFRLSLSRRVKRPDYSDLQPFTYVDDPVNQRTGNPGLRVQRNDQAELTYTFDGHISIIGTYERSVDHFNVIYQRSGDILVKMPGNTGTVSTFGLALNYPVKISKGWNMVNKADLGNDRFTGSLLQGQVDQGMWRYRVSTSQRISLGKCQVQLSGRYTSASQDLIYYRQSSANVSAGISRKFFSDQASVRLGISDIFKTQRNNTQVNFGSLNYTDEGTFESRRISLNLSWRFGNKKIHQAAEHQRGNADEKGRSGS